MTPAAEPTCPKCNKHLINVGIIVTRLKPLDAVDNLLSVSCSNCGYVFSVLPMFEIRDKYEHLIKRINRIESKLGLTPFEEE
jgi:transcription elongation factor Elf1